MSISAWEAAFDHLDEIMASADSVSLFTDFGEDIGQLWQKTRVGPTDPRVMLKDAFGAQAAIEQLNPVPSLRAANNFTEQLGVAGSWADRLPHFRAEAVLGSGEQLQSEYMVPRRFGLAALRAVHSIASGISRPSLDIRNPQCRCRRPLDEHGLRQ